MLHTLILSVQSFVWYTHIFTLHVTNLSTDRTQFCNDLILLQICMIQIFTSTQFCNNLILLQICMIYLSKKIVVQRLTLSRFLVKTLSSNKIWHEKFVSKICLPNSTLNCRSSSCIKLQPHNISGVSGLNPE